MSFLNIFLDFSINYSFISRFFTSLRDIWCLPTPKFSIEILKRVFEKTLKRFFQKTFWIIYRGTSKSRIFVWVTSHVKTLSVVTKFGHVFAINNFNLHTKNYYLIISAGDIKILNSFLSYKSCKNWWIITKFWYDFVIKNFSYLNI